MEVDTRGKRMAIMFNDDELPRYPAGAVFMTRRKKWVDGICYLAGDSHLG